MSADGDDYATPDEVAPLLSRDASAVELPRTPTVFGGNPSRGSPWSIVVDGDDGGHADDDGHGHREQGQQSARRKLRKESRVSHNSERGSVVSGVGERRPTRGPMQQLSQWATGGSRGAANAHSQRNQTLQLQQQQSNATRKEKVGAYNKYVALPSPTSQVAFSFPPVGHESHWPGQPTHTQEHTHSSAYNILGHSPGMGVHEGLRGRITVCCTAAAYNTKKLRKHLQDKYQGKPGFESFPTWYQEAIYAPHWEAPAPSLDRPPADVFYFEYGVIVCWGLSKAQEAEVFAEVVPFEVNKLPAHDVEVDTFEFQQSNAERPQILNDVIRINNIQDHQCKLAISHALAQSLKLVVFEQSIEQTIDSMRSVPEDLARTGKVHMSRVDISMKIGQLFLQKAAVNLLSDVLDIPEFFWSVPDYLVDLYKAARSYLEISARVEVLNTRLEVLQGMLEILKDQQNQLHGEKLEWIVIWLIFFELLIGIAGIAVDVFLRE